MTRERRPRVFTATGGWGSRPHFCRVYPTLLMILGLSGSFLVTLSTQTIIFQSVTGAVSLVLALWKGFYASVFRKNFH